MTRSAIPQISLRSPSDLLDVIPYMMGFRPEESLIVVGIDRETQRSKVSIRVDLPGELGELVEPMPVIARALISSGAGSVLVAVLSEDMPEPDPRIRWADLTAVVVTALTGFGFDVVDFVLSSRTRWWSALCVDAGCCPVTGNPRASQISVLECELVHQGVPTHASREAAIAVVAMVDEVAAETVSPLLEDAERRLATARAENKLAAVLRQDLQLMLAEIRRHHDDPTRRLTHHQLARLAVALREVQVRDEIWRQLDARLVDLDWVLGDMASRLPGRYRAAPLFIWGWQSWRNGSSMLGSEAARRALEADPDYSAARMLNQMVWLGLDPQTTPTLSALDQG